MSDLLPHQKNLQSITEIIKFTLGVDVFVVDDQMVAIAGTGPYRSNIGTKRPRDSYVDVTIHRGDGQTVIDPRYTHQCYRCEYRTLCPYSMVMCRPLVNKNRIKGLIGFLGFSESQRRNMITRSSFLCDISDRMDFLWETAGLDQHQFFRHPRTRELIDLFEEGLILTTSDHEVINLNERAESYLGLRGGVAGEKHMSRIIQEEIKAGRLSRSESVIMKEYPRGGRSLTGHENVPGHVVVISDKSVSHQTWRGCPLTSPALSMIVGTSGAIIRLREQAAHVARSSSTVLITGETGVGKELAARYIHQVSPRWSAPFETVNCAAIPDSLFESECFGYASGAFTGAVTKGKKGLFQAAHGGTLFLDEIGRLSPANQAKILRVLEDGLVQRLGDEHRHHVDVRILAASNMDLARAVSENRFLPDLYYRLAVIPLTVPPLRDRTEDIPLLLAYFSGMFQEALPRSDFRGFSEEVLDHFADYHWPGNIRELKNTVEYVMNMVHGRQVKMDDLPFQTRDLPSRTRPAPITRHRTRPVDPMPRLVASDPVVSLEELERRQIRLALRTFGHHTEGKRQAARHLGISLSTLYRKMAKAGLWEKTGEA